MAELNQKEIMLGILCSTLIQHCCVGLSLNVTENNGYAIVGNPLKLDCILDSGTVDTTKVRTWTVNGVTVMTNGVLSGSSTVAYEEELENSKFILVVPTFDYSLASNSYSCSYVFDTATTQLTKTADMGSISKEYKSCISGQTISYCWWNISSIRPSVLISACKFVAVSVTGEEIQLKNDVNITSESNADNFTESFLLSVPYKKIDSRLLKVKFSCDVGPFLLEDDIEKQCGLMTLEFFIIPVFIVFTLAMILNCVWKKRKCEFLTKSGCSKKCPHWTLCCCPLCVKEDITVEDNTEEDNTEEDPDYFPCCKDKIKGFCVLYILIAVMLILALFNLLFFYYGAAEEFSGECDYGFAAFLGVLFGIAFFVIYITSIFYWCPILKKNGVPSEPKCNASEVNLNSVTISWTNNAKDNVNSYKIYQKECLGFGGWIKLKELPVSPSTEAFEENLKLPKGNYRFGVSSENVVGESTTWISHKMKNSANATPL